MKFRQIKFEPEWLQMVCMFLWSAPAPSHRTPESFVESPLSHVRTETYYLHGMFEQKDIISLKSRNRSPFQHKHTHFQTETCHFRAGVYFISKDKQIISTQLDDVWATFARRFHNRWASFGRLVYDSAGRFDDLVDDLKDHPRFHETRIEWNTKASNQNKQTNKQTTNKCIYI